MRRLTWDFAQKIKMSATMLYSCTASGFDSFTQLALRQDNQNKLNYYQNIFN